MVTSFSIVFLMSKIVSQIHVSLFIDKINIFFVKIHPCYGAEETAEWNKILVRKPLISPPFYGLYTQFLYSNLRVFIKDNFTIRGKVCNFGFKVETFY